MVGINENEASVYDKFNDTIKFKNGRYEVELPFKENHPILPDNYTICKSRQEKMRNKLNEDEELKRNYDNVFKEQLEAGIIEKDEIGTITYLPHREVVRKDKSSTKVRVVFDASIKRNENASLNEVLYKAPCLNPELYKLLLKFRVHPIGIVADIEKAYLQISVVEEHRDFLRFLYYDDIYKTIPHIVPYRFCRVIFGATCSQFLLNGTIRKHAEKFDEMDPEFVRKVKGDFYVDDLTTGVSSTEGVHLYKKVRIRFMEANFNVRKWRTNDLALRNLINDSEKDPSYNEKVLGIPWDNQEDKLILGVSEIFAKAEDVKPTKRNILRVIASIYDPVGYLAPIVINLKLLFQEICHLGLSGMNI